MMWFLFGVIVLFNVLLVANYIQAGRMVRKISVQNSMLSYAFVQDMIWEPTEEEPHLKVVDDPPTTDES